MLWFLVLGLLVWAMFLTFRVSDLKERTQWLERRLLDVKDQLEAGAVVRPVAAKPEPQAQPRPKPRAAAERFVPPEPVRMSAPAALAEAPAPEPAPRRPAGPPPRQVARAWLEENGLAWAGGAALALGGLFLVTYAAQRGVFTPAMRIAAAAGLGAVLLGASEWLKRRSGHALAAALAAGAGAATLYGAAWASHGLYGLIGAGVAGGLLAATSLGLLAMAFRHGEPLALLALAGGFLAPLVTGLDQWTPIGLTAYLAVLTATGFGVAAVRRWGPAGMTTLVGAAVWGLLALVDQSGVRVAALAAAPVVLAFAALQWRRRTAAPAEAGSRDVFDLLPPVALMVGAGLLAALWTFTPGDGLAPAALGTIGLAALSAYGVRRDLVSAPLQLAAYLTASAAVLWGWSHPASGAYQLWLAAVLVAVAVAGVVSALGREGSGARWAGGAAAAVLLLATNMAAPLPALGWAPEAVAALLLLGAAAVLARASGEPGKALAPAIWIWTAGAAALAALNEALDPRFLPLGAAVFALAVALLHARLRWRGFAAVTLAAGLAALTALISPLMFGALQAGDLPWPAFAGIAAAAAAAIFAAARITGRIEGSRPSAEALSTGALVVLLAGGFLLLRPWGPAGGMDPFLEASLRTLLILVAGLTSALATPVEASPEDRLGEKVLPGVVEELYSAVVSHEQPGVIGRWRGQALLLVGLAHGLVFQGLMFNPLWASWTPAVAGPPILDSLLAGYLAPAVLLAAATLGRVSIHRALLAAHILGAAVFGFAWQMLEVRRLFQGASLHAGADVIGRAEIAVYAVLLLLSASSTLWLGDLAGRRRLTVSPFAPEISLAGRAGAWAALAAALLVFGFAASPWWGPIDRPLEGPFAVALLLGVYALGAAIPLALASPAGKVSDPLLLRALRLGGVAIVFAFVNLAVRWAFRGYDMRPDLREASLETWAFSAVWGLYGFGLLVYGAARRSNDLRGAGLVVLMITLAKIFLFDMSRLDGIIRAGSFLAVGALLMAAAVIVRRLGGADGLPFGLGRKPSAEAAD